MKTVNSVLAGLDLRFFLASELCGLSCGELVEPALASLRLVFAVNLSSRPTPPTLDPLPAGAVAVLASN